MMIYDFSERIVLEEDGRTKKSTWYMPPVVLMRLQQYDSIGSFYFACGLRVAKKSNSLPTGRSAKSVMPSLFYREMYCTSVVHNIVQC